MEQDHRQANADALGTGGNGAGIVHSTDSVATAGPQPSATTPGFSSTEAKIKFTAVQGGSASDGVQIKFEDNAAIVGSAQAVEHYEIARYGTLIAWAESLGHDDIIRLLNTNLNEEKAADKKLSTVAVRKGVNRKAAS